jgi:pyrroloquinoline quinone biosynthesis protein D
MSKPFNLDSIPSVSPLFRFQWEEVQQCHVILYPEGMVKLSGSAGEIMKRVDGNTRIEDIIHSLEQQFEQSELTDDVMKFIEVAYGNNWIRFTN